jgi:gamma-glutamyltranspeptidase/glutathione hydrolase
MRSHREGDPNGPVLIEEDAGDTVIATLQAIGHPVQTVQGFERFVFGRGQIIRRDPVTGVLWGGSDGRADGGVATW